jgi:hypothetical protein
MMEINLILGIMANISFWVCVFMAGCTLGSGRSYISSLIFIPLIVGWVFLFASSSNIIDGFTSAIVSEWYVYFVFAIIFLITSLGSGYLCGRFFRRGEK